MLKYIVIILLAFCLLPDAPAAQGLPGMPQAPVTSDAAPASTPGWLAPVKRELLAWNAYINREIPLRMRELRQNPSAWILLTSVLAALAYGILHTLGPGHGKMVVSSYFLTHGTRFWRGVLVGAQVAFSHVIGAVIIVLTTDLILRNMTQDPADQVWWLRLIGYSMIVLVGSFMLVQGIRHALGKVSSGCSHCGAGHHQHQQHRNTQETLLAWGVGAVPCTGSLLILLYAMAHNVLWLGLLMVLFVAIGMALTMTALGCLSLWGRQALVKRFNKRLHHMHKWRIGFEIFGALVIVLLGLLLLLSTRWLPLGASTAFAA